MNWKHKVVNGLFSNAGNYYKHRRNGLRILAYHSVGTPAYRDEMDLYNVCPSRFEEHINSLAQFEEIRVNSLGNTEVDENALTVAFTFDDGYLDNLKYVAPLMEKHKYPWNIFVVSDFIKNNKKHFMSSVDLLELSDYKYVTIGSHGKSHIHLSACNNDQLKKELHDSKKYLEDLLGKNVSSISYPFGSANKQVIAESRNAGYSIGCCSYSNINLSSRDTMSLCRTPIFSYDNSNMVAQKMFGMWDWMKYFTEDPCALTD